MYTTGRSRAELWGQIRKRAEGVKSRTGLWVRFDQRGHIRGWLKGSDHGRAGVDLDTRYIPF